MRRLGTVAVIAGLAALLAGCGGSSSGGQDNPIVAQNSNGPSSATSCPQVPTPSSTPQQYSSEPTMCIELTSYTATIVTNQGTVVATLDGTKAPHTVNSFKFLADHKYFDNSPCHRLTTQGIFVLQCGDPTGTGQGGPTYQFKDENLANASYTQGVVAMANSGPNTNGSQFFLIYKDSATLPKKYTVIGKITEGLNVVQKVANSGEDDSNGPGDGHPNTDVIIKNVNRT